MKKNICDTCTYCTKNGRCNRLVIPGGFGMNDRTGSHYKRDNKCPYYQKGDSNKSRETNPFPLYNS